MACKKFQLPEKFKTIFKYKQSIFEQSEKNEEWVEHIYNYSMISRERFSRLHCLTDMVSHFYAFCDSIERYENLVKHYLLFFLLDDHTETDWGDMARDHKKSSIVWGGIKDGMDKFIDSTKFIEMNAWKPYQLVLFAVMESIVEKYTHFQRQRYVKFWKEYCDGCIEETVYWENRRRFKSIDEFLNVRIRSAGTMAAIQLVEYSSGITVPEHEWNSLKMQQLLDLAAKLIVYCNDLFSFEKEFKEQHKELERTMNVVAVTALVSNCSIPEAMDKCAQIYVELEWITMALMNEILSEKETSEPTKLFVQHLAYLTGGHWQVSTCLDRYNKLDHI